MNAWLLCWSLLTSPIDTPAALRGCLHAQKVVQAAAQDGTDAKTLFAVGYVESRWQSGQVSSAGCCGPWQVQPRWAGLTCQQLDTVEHAAAAASSAMRYWAGRCGGRSSCVLRGYACGNDGIAGKCGGAYVSKVAAARRLLFGKP